VSEKICDNCYYATFHQFDPQRILFCCKGAPRMVGVNRNHTCEKHVAMGAYLKDLKYVQTRKL